MTVKSILVSCYKGSITLIMMQKLQCKALSACSTPGNLMNAIDGLLCSQANSAGTSFRFTSFEERRLCQNQIMDPHLKPAYDREDGKFKGLMCL